MIDAVLASDERSLLVAAPDCRDAAGRHLRGRWLDTGGQPTAAGPLLLDLVNTGGPDVIERLLAPGAWYLLAPADPATCEALAASHHEVVPGLGLAYRDVPITDVFLVGLDGQYSYVLHTDGLRVYHNQQHLVDVHYADSVVARAGKVFWRDVETGAVGPFSRVSRATSVLSWTEI